MADNDIVICCGDRTVLERFHGGYPGSSARELTARVVKVAPDHADVTLQEVTRLMHGDVMEDRYLGSGHDV